MNSNWYKDYLLETRRRQDDLKFAEDYRRARYDPDEPPAPGFGQRFFSAIRGTLVRWGERLQTRWAVPGRDWVHKHI